MKHLITSLALKIIPEDGVLRNAAKRVYAKLYPVRSNDIIHRVLTETEQSMLNDAVRIGFIGDLILLRDMIDVSYRKNGGGIL